MRIFQKNVLSADYNADLANALGNLAESNAEHDPSLFETVQIQINRSYERYLRVEVKVSSANLSADELKAGKQRYTNEFADVRPSNALSAPLARALAVQCDL